VKVRQENFCFRFGKKRRPFFGRRFFPLFFTGNQRNFDTLR